MIALAMRARHHTALHEILRRNSPGAGGIYPRSKHVCCLFQHRRQTFHFGGLACYKTADLDRSVQPVAKAAWHARLLASARLLTSHHSLPQALSRPFIPSSSPARTMAVDRAAVMGPNGTSQQKKVMFFDIDNCLYPKSSKVHHMMGDLINRYFATHLSLPPAEAARLHREYYTNYGLAIEGLVRHHDIDPLEFNARVDDALPLETLIRPREELTHLLRAIDRSRVRPWLLTNAYVNHARRVVRLLGIDDQFEGMTFCDYASVPIVCKPDRAMYDKAMREAGVDKYEDCYFVDDSYINCQKAEEIGWHTAHLIEEEEDLPRMPACKYQIRDIVDLRRVFPELFKHKEQQVKDG